LQKAPFLIYKATDQLSCLDLAGALETLAEVAPDAGIGELLCHHQLALALGTKELLTGFHRTGAGSYRHRTQVDAGVALFAEGRFFPKGERHMPIFAATDKTECLCLPHLCTHPHTSSAQNTVVVMEGVSHIFNSAADSNVLYGP
jgi:hypothetical protein